MNCTQKTLKVRILSRRNTAQAAVPIIWLDQKKALSTIFAFLISLGLQNLQASLPFLSIQLHHLSPTSSLPVIFFTTQKSKELQRITKMKVMIVESIMDPMTKQKKKAKPLKAKVEMQATGWAAFLRSYLLSLASSCPCSSVLPGFQLLTGSGGL